MMRTPGLSDSGPGATPMEETGEIASDNNDTAMLDRLAEEFAERGRRGEAPSIAEYEARYPEWAARIRELFPSVAMMEQLKRRVRSVRDTGAAALPDRFGEFRVIRELGRGGMGIVYEAVQESLHRHVALKVIPRHNVHDPKRLARFQRESQAVASLHHTNIVPIFGVGEHDGLPFYAMQFIDGEGLDERVAGWRAKGAPELKEHWRFVAKVGAQAAEALEYAHGQGVLHRDVKPANILIDEHESAWITDFGLVKLAGRDDLTTSGDVIGTLRYLAPEALRGESDARSDVYSLGLTLYELLTLQPPFGDVTPSELLRCVTAEQPTRPRKLDITIPIDLETIVLKATAREPEHRYPSAGELAADLRSFLDDQPIRARRATAPERLARWCRRNKVVAGLSAVAAFSLLFAAIVGWAGFASEQRKRGVAEAATKRAEDATKRAEDATQRAEDNVRLSLAAFEELFNTLAARGDFRPGRTGEGPPGNGPGRGQGRGGPDRPGMLGGDRFRGGDPGDRPPRPPGDDRGRPLAPPGRQPNNLPENDAILIGNILSFYDHFAEKNETNSKLQGEAARANRRVAALYKWLGRDQEAEDTYTKAARRYEELAARFPDEPSYRFELARTYAMDDVWPADLGSTTVDEARLRKALEIVGKLASEAKDDPTTYVMAQARWLRRLGSTLERLGRNDEAETAFRESIGIDRTLFEQQPGTIMYRVGMLATQEVLVNFLFRHQRGAEAVKLLESVADEMRTITSGDHVLERDLRPLEDLLETLAETASEHGQEALAREFGSMASRLNENGPPSKMTRPGPRGPNGVTEGGRRGGPRRGGPDGAPRGRLETDGP